MSESDKRLSDMRAAYLNSCVSEDADIVWCDSQDRPSPVPFLTPRAKVDLLCRTCPKNQPVAPKSAKLSYLERLYANLPELVANVHVQQDINFLMDYAAHVGRGEEVVE